MANSNDDVRIEREDTYRSKPKVNMTPDMVQVILSMPRWKWRRIKALLKLKSAK